METEESRKRLEAVEKPVTLAEKVSVSLVQFSLAWLLAHPAVTSPIMGPRTAEQLRDNLGALDVKLDAAVLEKVDEIVPTKTDVR
jgi:aryl-alcohol dehydrogenase-like predicted oxidoreductase